MAAEPFNTLAGLTVGIPEISVVDSSGNVVTNVLTSGNVAAGAVYSSSYNYSNGAPVVSNGSLVVSKNSGSGIFVDPSSPTYGWRDLLSTITVEETGGANRPTFVTYLGGIKQYRFSNNDQVWTEFHLPHDYAPGTEIFIHAHWSHIASNVVSGGVTWGFEMTYAKGHDQAAWHSPVTTTVQQNASTVQYQHMIAETQASGGALLVTGDLEPDGVILARVYVSANDMSPSTLPFLHYVDIHYQSTGMATKQKSPNFYT